MKKLSLLLFLTFITSPFVQAAHQAAAPKDSVIVNIKIPAGKKTSIAITNQFQQIDFISFANEGSATAEISRKIPLPANQLLSYRTYYNGKFFNYNLFTRANDRLSFELQPDYSLKQINPEIRNTIINHLFNIYHDLSIKKPFTEYDQRELEEHYLQADSIYGENSKKLENLLQGNSLADADYQKLLNYLEIDYYSRILAPIGLNFPYSARLDAFITPHLPSIEAAVRNEHMLMIENKKIVKYLMKYYLFHLDKKEDDLVSYRDVLLSKNFGNIILPVLVEKLEIYPTKQDQVYNETFKKLSVNTHGQYDAYLENLKRKLSPAKINAENIFLISSQDNQKLSLRDLLNRYKGNTIVFDFWASWCLPCIKEFPAISSLEAKYSNQPVKFIGISLDEDSKISSWQNVLKKQTLNNVYQYKLITPRTSPLTSFFRIESLPRYIVLNNKRRAY